MTDPGDLTAGQRAIDFTRKQFVFDGLSLYYTTEERYAERCLAGGVNAANVTFAAEVESWDEALRKIDEGLERVAKSPIMVQASTVADLRRAKQAGKLAVVVGTQGASMLDGIPSRVRLLHRLGTRFFGLTYTGANLFADGCGERRDAGLTFLGQELIEEVNALDLILDLSHCGHRTRSEAVARAKHPVCTHSNAYAVHANDRNTKDGTALAMAAKGGMVGLCAMPRSIWPAAQSSMDRFLDHLDHWVKTLGIDHVGLGFDFVEGFVESRAAGVAHKPPKWRVLRPDIFGTEQDFYDDRAPLGIESIRLLPNVTQALFDRGYAEQDVGAVLGGNWLRKFEQSAG